MFITVLNNLLLKKPHYPEKVWDFSYLRYQTKQLLPMRLSRGKNFPFVLDLLLLQNEQTYHYVLIINLMKLVAKINGKEYRDRNELCRNCFHICSSADVLLAHQKSCLEKGSLQITMPNPANNKLKFENYAARWFSPFVVYFELESLLVPVATAKSSPMTSSTCALEQHLPCSYCLIVVEHNNTEPIHFDIYTGPDCMKRFIRKIKKVAMFFCHQKRKFPNFIGAAPS